MALNVLDFLNDKNILVSGSTGFLGKIFVEKILRTQPGINRIFVLIRAKDVASAKHRFKNEVMRLDLFKTLREQHGDNFESFVFQKVVPLVGDIAADHNLGIDTESTREHLWENLDAIANNAANTVLDDRYDISLNVNAKGPKNIVDIAKRCRNLQILLHVSTVFVEKILRTQPGIHRIFVLIRAKDVASAKLRFKNEIMRLELFKTLKEQHGDNFESFVFQKVVPLVGDIAADHNLGINTESTREHLWENLDAVVNVAASTVFDDRYDISLNVNTKGVANVVEFAKRCHKLQILLHVSTAYVVGHSSGLIKERPVKMGGTSTANEGPEHGSGRHLPIDIQGEFDLLEKTLAKIHKQNPSTTHTASTSSVKDIEAKHLKELGLERARKFGWPNTYSFTKAMGEKLLENMRGNLPVVILRPTIIESTLAEPFPGWMEGTRTMDSVIVGYGKGRVSIFLADPELILDVIPADLVVNAMIIGMAAHAYDNGLFIYHVASSVANPLRNSVVADEAYKYFSKYPCVGRDGNIIHVKQMRFLKSMKSFRRYMHRHYKVPLKVFGVVNKVLCCNMIFPSHYNRMLRNYNKVMLLAEFYEPYVFFPGRFDITNTEGLFKKISEEDRKAFNFDAKCIDWVHYLSNVHIPGLVKYVLK